MVAIQHWGQLNQHLYLQMRYFNYIYERENTHGHSVQLKLQINQFLLALKQFNWHVSMMGTWDKIILIRNGITALEGTNYLIQLHGE